MGECERKPVSTLPSWATGWLVFDGEDEEGRAMVAEKSKKDWLSHQIAWRWRRFLYTWVGWIARWWERFVQRIEHKQRWHFSCSCGSKLELDMEIVDYDKQLETDYQRMAAAGWVPDTYPHKPERIRPMWSCSVQCIENNLLERFRHAYGRHRVHLEMNLEDLDQIDPVMARTVYDELVTRHEWPFEDGYDGQHSYDELKAREFGNAGGYDALMKRREQYPLATFKLDGTGLLRRQRESMLPKKKKKKKDRGLAPPPDPGGTSGAGKGEEEKKAEPERKPETELMAFLKDRASFYRKLM